MFLTEEVNKLWRKSEDYNDYSTYIDEDNKTIIVHIYHEPIIDNWNVGHYGCTNSTVIDKSKNEKYNTIKDFYKVYNSVIEELFKIADSIDLEKLSIVCTEDTLNKIASYKNMVEQLKTKIK